MWTSAQRVDISSGSQDPGYSLPLHAFALNHPHAYVKRRLKQNTTGRTFFVQSYKFSLKKWIILCEILRNTGLAKEQDEIETNSYLMIISIHNRLARISLCQRHGIRLSIYVIKCSGVLGEVRALQFYISFLGWCVWVESAHFMNERSTLRVCTGQRCLPERAANSHFTEPVTRISSTAVYFSY